jgi:hypothetical protein
LQFCFLEMNTRDANLAIYLNDHLAGAVVALEILDGLLDHDDVELKRCAQELRSAIEEDRVELVRLMGAANIATSSVRRAIGWLGEKAVALKLTFDDPADGRLRTFELLETIALGIDGKRALWAVLRTISVNVPSLQAADYARLARRAEDQRGTVEAFRLQWAAITFTNGAR